MQEDNKPPGFGQYLLAVILGILALAAGGISLSMNVAFGLKTGLVMAAIFALSDGAKIILPMISAALGVSSSKRKLAYGVAVAISLVAATSYLLETQATRLLQSQSRTMATADARTDTNRLRKELDGIKEASSVAALEALEAAKDQAAKAEAANGGCLTKCQIKLTEHGEVLERLGQARRRDRLEVKLASLNKTITDAPAEALGASNTLAGLTGGNADQIAAHEALIKAVFMLIILELLATFSGDAGNLFVSTWKARRNRTKSKRKAMKSEIAKTKADEISPKKPAVSYWMQRLSKERPDIAARVIAGKISCYRGCIEAGIRKQPKRSWSKLEDFGITATT